jgi:hypothetical protein
MPETNYAANPKPSDLNYVRSRQYDVCPGSGGGGGGLTCSGLAEDITGATTGILCSTENIRYFAQRFVASANETMCKLILRLRRDTGSISGTLTVRLYSHNPAVNGTPNAAIESKTVNITTFGTTEGDIELTGWTTALVSGTTYWIGIDDPTNGGLFSGGVTWFTKTAAVGQANMIVMSADGSIWVEFDNLRQAKLQIYKLA